MDPMGIHSPLNDLPPPPAYEQTQQAFDQKTSFAIQRSLNKLDEEGFEVWDDSLYRQAVAARQSGMVAGSSQTGSSSMGGYGGHSSNAFNMGGGKEKSMWMQGSSMGEPSSPPPPHSRPALPPIPTQQPYQSLNIGAGSRPRGYSTSSSQTTSPVEETSPWGYTASGPRSSAHSTPTPTPPSFTSPSAHHDYRPISPQVHHTPVNTPGRVSRTGSRPPSTNPQQQQWGYSSYGGTGSGANSSGLSSLPPPVPPLHLNAANHEASQVNHHISLPPPQRPTPINNFGADRPRVTSLNTNINSSFNNHARPSTIPFNPLTAYSNVERDARTGGMKFTSDNPGGHQASDFYNSSVSAIFSKNLPAPVYGSRPPPNIPSATSYQLPAQYASVQSSAPYAPQRQASDSPSSGGGLYPAAGYSNPLGNNQGTYANYGYGNAYGGSFAPQQPQQQQQQQQFYPGAVSAAHNPQSYGGPNPQARMPPGAQAPQNIYDRRFY